MSAYAEWKHGLITEDQYRAACMEEEWLDQYYTDKENEDDCEDEEEGD